MLGLVCTALAFVIFSVLITEVGPSRALVITYINPVVAVALGVAILGEQPGAGAVAGLLLILAGSWLSTDGRLPPGLMRRIPGRPPVPPRRLRAVAARAIRRAAAVSRILVTGAAGTLGAAVVRRLLRDPDFEARVSDSRPLPQWIREGAAVHAGDLREEAETALRGCTRAIVLGDDAPPFTALERRVALVRAAAAAGLERVTFVDAGDAPLVAAHAEHGLPFTVCRTAGVYGPASKAWSARCWPLPAHGRRCRPTRTSSRPPSTSTTPPTRSWPPRPPRRRPAGRSRSAPGRRCVSSRSSAGRPADTLPRNLSWSRPLSLSRRCRTPPRSSARWTGGPAWACGRESRER